jgi:hypothetical protein
MTDDLAPIAPPPGAHGSWSAAYAAAEIPAPKAAEMIEALEHVVIYGHGNASATAAVNGGVYDAQTMRRLAAVEAAKGVLQRIAEKWGDLPEWVRGVILGTPRKRPAESGENRANR